MTPQFTYRASLIRVIDGDTIEARIDLGFDVWTVRTIRFYGIDAWESRTRDLEEKAKGLQAKAFVQAAMDRCGGEFVLVSHGVGKYGRCLGTIYIESRDLNQQLLQEGLAVEYKP